MDKRIPNKFWPSFESQQKALSQSVYNIEIHGSE